MNKLLFIAMLAVMVMATASTTNPNDITLSPEDKAKLETAAKGAIWGTLALICFCGVLPCICIIVIIVRVM